MIGIESCIEGLSPLLMSFMCSKRKEEAIYRRCIKNITLWRNTETDKNNS